MPSLNPPRLAEKFFTWFCHVRHLEGLEGDLYELFERRIATKGIRTARLFYLLDMVSLFRSSVAKPIFQNSKFNAMSMLENYFKTAVRMAWKRKGFSFINLFGLTIGLTSVLFIGLFVHDEYSYDQHISNSDNKFRVYNTREGSDGEVNLLPIVPPVFTTSLRNDFPQVEKAGRLLFDYGGTVFNVNEQAFSETKGVYAEPEALDILDFEFVEGSFDSSTVSHSILLSESLYQKFFRDEPFGNQSVKLTKTTLQVAAVFKDLPDQSHLDLEYIFPFKWAADGISSERIQSWIWQQFFTYVELRRGTDFTAFQDQFRSYVNENSTPFTEKYGFGYVPSLQKVGDVHLHSSGFEWEIAETSSFQSILFLSIAAFIILLIACLNFINLTTAQALKRAKEVSVRKFVGAQRSQLMIQYGLESSLYTFIAGAISLVLFGLLLSFFNSFTEKSFVLLQVLTLKNLGIYFGLLLGLGLLSGWYPAVVLTSFNPLAILHGVGTKRSVKRHGISFDPRQLMVGAQYVLSIGLILISLIMQSQYDFLRKTDMGFNKENLLVLPMTRAMKNDFDLTRDLFSGHSQILDVSMSFGEPGGIVAGDGVYVPSKQTNEFSSNMFIVDHNYLNTLKMELVAGRDFSKDLISDGENAFILNETAVRNFTLGTPEEAIGTVVKWKKWTNSDSTKDGRVIGVVADFNFKSLHNQVSSVVIHIESVHFQNLLIRIGKGDPEEALTFLEEQYRTLEPTRPFEPKFIDRTFERFYSSEQKLSQLFSVFTLLAILTATIGLFGLVSFSIVSRSKEISIRKVLGAGSGTIFKLLVFRYLGLVFVCSLIAIPTAYWLSDKWLQNFAYRIQVGAELIIPVAISMMFLTFLTVGFQALKGSMANPSDRLRSE